jgi:arylsulfatase A-like enzyme
VGFDYYFGTPMSHNEPPFVLVENDRVVNLDPKDPISITEMGEGGFFGTMLGGEEARFVEEYLATQYVEKAETFIRQNQDDPFFLYLATNNVHVPLTPHPRFQGKSDIGIYGDYILELDWLAGQILSLLEELGIADDTLVVFSSDNGAVHYDHAAAEGHLANGPLLGQKTDAWEGGHRVPFLARWPGVIEANTVSDDLVCLTDLLATTAAVAGVQPPEGAGPDSFNVLPALLDERGKKPCRETLHMTGIAGEAVRDGKWLYIPKQGSCGVTTEATDPWWIKMDALQELGFENNDYGPGGELKADAPPAQLYDLSADPEQTTNLFEQRPDVAEHMQALLVQIKKDGRSIR